MSISIIVAVARDLAIGRRGDQLAYVREDLLHFKAITRGHTIIMGRKTCLALPKHHLPERRNIVITRDPQWHPDAPDVEVAHSLAEALQLSAGDGEVFVIGGGEVYRQCIHIADRLYVTHLDIDAPDADTHFPSIGPEWTPDETSELKHDEKTGISFRFVNYRRSTANTIAN